jgi:DNA-binding NtrC family response regulator
MDVAVQWVRAALESARVIAGAEAILICAAGGMLAIGEVSCGSPSSEDLELLASGGGRWLRVDLVHGLLMAALPAAPKGCFSLPEQQLLQQVATVLLTPSLGIPLHDRTNAVERDAIACALRQTNGNKARAARLLGITRGGLYLKMKRYGLE